MPKEGRNKAFELKYSHEGGVLVVAVEKDSPAEKAGMKPDDIITALNGHPVGRFLMLRRELLSLSPDVQLNLTVFRDGTTLEIKSTLEKKEKED